MASAKVQEILARVPLFLGSSKRGIKRLADRMEAIEGIRRGLQQEERGEGRPLEEVFAEFRAQHGMAEE